VCGSAATFNDDLERARELRPDAVVIAVNDVAELTRADHLFTLHPEKMAAWRALQTIAFGIGALTHSGAAAPIEGVDIDYWWPKAGGKGTSAWGAARMAQCMGFDEVILCGAPLDPMPYAKRGPAKLFMCPAILRGYRDFIAADTDWHGPVRSMSGWTKRTFGEPDG
jgi:hypothetical protein